MLICDIWVHLLCGGLRLSGQIQQAREEQQKQHLNATAALKTDHQAALALCDAKALKLDLKLQAMEDTAAAQDRLHSDKLTMLGAEKQKEAALSDAKVLQLSLELQHVKQASAAQEQRHLEDMSSMQAIQQKALAVSDWKSLQLNAKLANSEQEFVAQERRNSEVFERRRSSLSMHAEVLTASSNTALTELSAKLHTAELALQSQEQSHSEKLAILDREREHTVALHKQELKHQEHERMHTEKLSDVEKQHASALIVLKDSELNQLGLRLQAADEALTEVRAELTSELAEVRAELASELAESQAKLLKSSADAKQLQEVVKQNMHKSDAAAHALVSAVHAQLLHAQSDVEDQALRAEEKAERFQQELDQMRAELEVSQLSKADQTEVLEEIRAGILSEQTDTQAELVLLKNQLVDEQSALAEAGAKAEGLFVHNVLQDSEIGTLKQQLEELALTRTQSETHAEAELAASEVRVEDLEGQLTVANFLNSQLVEQVASLRETEQRCLEELKVFELQAAQLGAELLMVDEIADAQQLDPHTKVETVCQNPHSVVLLRILSSMDPAKFKLQNQHFIDAFVSTIEQCTGVVLQNQLVIRAGSVLLVYEYSHAEIDAVNRLVTDLKHEPQVKAHVDALFSPSSQSGAYQCKKSNCVINLSFLKQLKW